MTLPGLWWYVKDEYGTYWNDEAMPSYFHAWYFKQMAIRSFPEFHFVMVAHQRSPIRRMPIPYIYVEDNYDEKIESKRVFVSHQIEDF